MKSTIKKKAFNGCCCNPKFYKANGFGVYDNQVLMPIPKHMKGHGERHPDGVKKCICIDGCLVKEIQWLWGQGITTTGNCCGHNRKDINGDSYGYIGVVDEDIEKMKKLGYKVAPPIITSPEREDSFFPKTTTTKKRGIDEQR
jgi:hypothetical protein